MPGRPIRIAAQLHPQQGPFANLRAAARRADELGYDIVYTWDHFFPLYGDRDGEHYECFTTLAAFAQVTERAEIGPLVACNSYRNPQLVADMARTIDHISGGRFILGLGSGWKERDYDEYGYEFGTPGSRLADLAEALPRITNRWAKLNPPPTRDIPILIGGGGERKTLRLTAQYANTWHGFGNAETLIHKKAVLDRWCAEIGRDPSEIERSTSTRRPPSEVADGLAKAGIGMVVIPMEAGDTDGALALARQWLQWRDTA